MSTPSFVDYTGNGSTTDYVFPFDYIDSDYVKVTLDNVASTAFTLISQNTVRFDAAPANGVAIRIYRETPGDAIVTWADGAVILGRHLNTASNQPRHIAEEARDKSEEAVATAADAVTAAEAAVTDAAVHSAAAAASATAAAATAAGMEADLSAAVAAATATAEGHADDAAASAAAAATSAANAATSVVAAASSYDAFDDRFLGTKTEDPTLDNDGNALVTGALYFNSTISKMKVYTGASWQLAFNDTAAASAVTNDSGVAGATVAAALNTLDSGKQDASANLDSWSGLAPAAKQDASANLTSWAALAPAAKQDASANLDAWSAIATSTKQAASSVLTAWAGLAPATVLGAAANLNSVTTSGFYKLDATVTNGPTETPVNIGYSNMMVCAVSDTIIQIIGEYSTGVIWIRTGNPPGSWGTWRRVYQRGLSGECRAWVSFNGTGTVGIGASFNVSSVTDNGTGDYTVNFTTALADANYCVNISGEAGSPTGVSFYVWTTGSRQTTSVRFKALNGGAAADYNNLFVSIHR